MSTRSHLRLLVLHVLVISLMGVLIGRLWYLQVLTEDRFVQAAEETRTRDVILPALRGEIYDSAGRPLVSNRSELVVSVNRSELLRQPNDGEAVLRRLAKLLPNKTYEGISKQIRLCSSGVDKPCWNGSPYEPIPVARNASAKTALQIMERQAAFPGIVARPTSVRSYPSPAGVNAAHMVGHLAPITEQELEARQENEVRLTGSALVGRGGLEGTYEKYLRGVPGVKSVVVDSRSRVTGTLRKTPPVPGSHLVTSINAEVQAIVEKAITDALHNAGSQAEAAAGVVLDVRTGRVIAMASVPTYDPSIWVGGISGKQYQRLTSDKAGEPMVFQATQGQYPVGSTFKVISLSAAVKAGWPLHGTYPCPSGYNVGGRTWHNYGSLSYGMISLHRSIVISCDTVFYRFAHLMWQRQGGTDPIKDPTEPIPHMAKKYGLGQPTGIDLPAESTGRVPDPAWKRDYWEETKDYYCKYAKKGYPEVAKKDPGRAAYLKKLAQEQCKRGYVWRAGDAVNLSIGQGSMLATPLQLARAYAAIANGGTVFSPRIGKAIVRPDGSVVKRINPPKVRELPLDDRVVTYLQDALADVPRSGTAAGTFAGFPLKKIPVAGKTGTAQAYGEEDTAWFASFAPANNPRYAVVAMVSQGGLGSQAAAPAVRQIYEGIYGVGKGDPALPNGVPPDELPRVDPGGALKPPPGYGDSAAKSKAKRAAPASQPALWHSRMWGEPECTGCGMRAVPPALPATRFTQGSWAAAARAVCVAQRPGTDERCSSVRRDTSRDAVDGGWLAALVPQRLARSRT